MVGEEGGGGCRKEGGGVFLTCVQRHRTKGTCWLSLKYHSRNLIYD